MLCIDGEIRICIDCPRKSLLHLVKSKSWNREKTPDNLAKLCAKLRAIIETPLPKCSKYKDSEKLDKWVDIEYLKNREEYMKKPEVSKQIFASETQGKSHRYGQNQMSLGPYIGKGWPIPLSLKIMLLKKNERKVNLEPSYRKGPAVCPICLKSDKVAPKGSRPTPDRESSEQRFVCNRCNHRFINTPFARTRLPDWVIDQVLELATYGLRASFIARFINKRAKGAFRISPKNVRNLIKRYIKILLDYELRAKGNWNKVTWQIDDTPQWLSIIKENSPESNLGYDKIKQKPIKKMGLLKPRKLKEVKKENAALCPYCGHVHGVDEEVLTKNRKELMFIKCNSCKKIYYLKLKQLAWITRIITEENRYSLVAIISTDRKAIHSERAARRALKITRTPPFKIKSDGYTGHPSGVKRVITTVKIEAIPKPKKSRNYDHTNIIEVDHRHYLRALGVPKKRTFRSLETLSFAVELSRFYSNFFLSHKFLEGKGETPARSAGIEYPYHKELTWSEFIRFAYNYMRESTFEKTDEKQPNAFQILKDHEYYDIKNTREIIPFQKHDILWCRIKNVPYKPLKFSLQEWSRK